MLRLSSLLPAAALALLLAACGPTERPAEAPAPPAPAPAATPAPPADTAAAAPRSAPADTSLLLRPGYVGPLRLNMKEADLLALLPPSTRRASTRSLEGIDYPVYEYRPEGQPAGTPPLLLEMVTAIDGNGNRLWRAQLQDARYRTAEGIGVGSTFGEARRAYGVQTIERAEGRLVAVSERVGMTWVLDKTGLPLDRLLRKDDIPPATRITGIILYQ
ncbi:hypothetical protein EJV47_05945 [Hymenobacter gummosus]|uniref:Lipoprotein n=1 Tax=Hymenobacter gummosus TaxID=1776032 RepID=A0A431U8G4_9BACT|nr:hypothetical protein [Hymenobacter gummosus]RTQ52551.1 hypothetical protein EJV47_05945 [Hymenobacter gummosus]